MERQVSELNAQNLANTAWAFATVSRPEERLFTALAIAAERRVNELNAQELANMASAFPTLGHSDEKLLTGLARTAERRVSDFNVSGLAMTLWAFSSYGGLNDAWSLFDHAKHRASRPWCLGASNLECEQSGWR